MKFCLSPLLLLFILLSSCSAQSTEYINKECKQVPMAEATYKRVIELDKASGQNQFIVKDFYMSGNLFMSAIWTGRIGLKYNGKCTYYYENGNKKVEGDFTDNKQSGIWTYWSEDIKDTTVTEFDESGKQKTIRNTLSFGTDTRTNTSSIDTSGKEMADKESSTNSPAYTSVEEDAEFRGGVANLGKFLSKNIRYPMEAESRRLGARVVIYFEIDKEGNIVNVRALTKPGFGLEEEALRVIRSMPNWKPAKQDGKFVRVRRTIPIVFRLPD